MSMDIELRMVLKKMGMDYFQKYYGNYNGTVADNVDPDKMGRVQLKVPSIYGNSVHAYWASPVGMPNGNGEGMFWIPSVGDNVIVTFENGNCRFPMWQHGYWGTKDTAGNTVLAGLYDEDGKPTKRQLTTKGGQTLLFDDTNKLIDIVDANGQHVTLSTGGITLVGDTLIALGAATAIHPAVLGDKEKILWDAVLEAIATITVTVGGVPTPINNIPAFTTIQSSMVDSILSNLVKLKS